MSCRCSRAPVWSWKRVKRQCHIAYCKNKVTHYVLSYGRKCWAVCDEHLSRDLNMPGITVERKKTGAPNVLHLDGLRHIAPMDRSNSVPSQHANQTLRKNNGTKQ